MATEVVWDVTSQEFHEVEVEPKNKKSSRYYEWRRREMARMIVYEGLTIRQVADIFGIHNCNVYRALEGLMGGIYSDVQETWKKNKEVSLERANATIKEKRRLNLLASST